MTAQEPGRRWPAGTWGPSRLMMLVACVFFALAALDFAFSGFHDNIGPAFAWLAAGFSACALSWALP